MLHLYAGNLFGGIERVLITLAKLRHLAPEMEPEFGLCFRGKLWDELTALGVPVHDLGAVRFSRPWTVLTARRRLARLLRERRFDAVACHACWPHAVFAGTVRAAGVPLVAFAHDTLAGTHWLERWAGRTPPNLVLANSHYTAATVPRVFPGVRTAVAYLPVELPELGSTGDAAAVRRELDTPAGDVVIVQASRLERWKGAHVTVAALARLAGVPGWTAWFAGGAQRPAEATYLAELRAAVDRAGVAGRVRFLGQRGDVPRLLRAADLFCQPNTAGEPFGIVFIEALAAGLPVVTSAIGGGAEVVTPACGVLVPPNDPDALAEVLRGLIGSRAERERLGAAGPGRARELCDPAAAMNRLQDLLTSVTDPRPAEAMS